ncbi:hypothetical protein L861_04955 [Litchfieldella anticariensis FP35 = DSM 16096]|uniref:Uncharacterized protein n=1 Tax=Litchfieldella anticariensis (strain DSM 16096 / CECT 5854 / CIP 108499 / LMG 22089 / FP35) TaxID=1121939 RepID=S2KNR0_LITA3|nr:hypothetical protein [Halomonas anticariensis]EPC02108.1 hypothetical protein L861_04955 [Halomonas anticariensis FP35 = DSM 16096]
MTYSEAKEHAPGRLHEIFSAPYEAFESAVLERKLHLDIALRALLDQPIQSSRLVLRVIHGWENGDDTPEALKHSEHPIGSLDDVARVKEEYRATIEQELPLPHDGRSLLAHPRDEAIAKAHEQGLEIDDETRRNPARWPTFENGLYLYTFFKIYHRLTYGEDESYRSIQCQTPKGPREIHEFHLDECEFAISTPPAFDDTGTTLLIVHEGELDPLVECLELHLG